MKVLKPLPHAVLDYAWAGTMIAAPWLMGFSRSDRAKWTHLVSGLSTLAVVATTDYRAQERQRSNDNSRSGTPQLRQQQSTSGKGAGLAEQIKNMPEQQQESVDLGPPTRFPEGVLE